MPAVVTVTILLSSQEPYSAIHRSIGRYTAGTRDRVAGERNGGLDSGVIV
jgi:hypothetical protein